jgi:hypothetical protein
MTDTDESSFNQAMRNPSISRIPSTKKLLQIPETPNHLTPKQDLENLAEKLTSRSDPRQVGETRAKEHPQARDHRV